MTAGLSELLRGIPSVTELLAAAPIQSLAGQFGEGLTKLELRQLLDDLRTELRTGARTAIPDPTELAKSLEQRLIRISQPIGRRAINGSGILLHTGLGRSPLCDEAIAAISGSNRYSVLQTSLDRGDRSLREEKIQKLMIELVGCEAMTLVNNNAAATMLILNTLAAGKEVIISRGQLIEIGGSFRMTEVMAQSGATLREVGTTNRTHLRDYEGAINENTGAIIHVHTSNYVIRGFAGTPEIGELVALGKKHGIPVIDDLGSGAIVPLHDFGISDEPLVKDSLAAGADVVCYSGDKLICGPQAGIIAGKKSHIEKIRKNPYARMFRVCKLTLAAMEATLPHFVNGTYRKAIPFYRMMSRPVAELEADARRLAELCGRAPGISASIADDISYVGSGSIPDEGIATKVVKLSHASIPPEDLAKRLRMGLPSVFGRVSGGAVLIDVRTLFEGEIDEVAKAVTKVVA